MTIQRMDHVGVVVDDLAGAKAFFDALGLEVLGEWSVDDPAAGRIIGLEGVRADVAMLGAPDGSGKVEFSQFHAPPGEGGDPHAPSNTPGLRHLTFEVDDLDAAVAIVRAHGFELVGEVAQFGDTYRLCYARGPEGIIVELAEKAG
jgi:catechol 2,3-dioxygenase-like lactoylglutathione lyase family enzyme